MFLMLLLLLLLLLTYVLTHAGPSSRAMVALLSVFSKHTHRLRQLG
jgi:hypothetical protein